MPKGQVIKAGIGYTVGNYLLKGLSFLTVPIFARLLSTEDFGIYNTFLAYETILFIILGCAIHSSYRNAKYRYDVDHKDGIGGHSYAAFVSSTMLMLLVNTLIILLLVNLFFQPIGNLLKLNRSSVNLLVVFSFSTAVINCYNTDASIHYQYKKYLLVSGLNAIGNLGLSILLITTIYSNQRYMGRIIGTVVPIAVLSLFICFRYFAKQRPKNQKEYLKWGLSYSLPIIFSGLSQVILSQFDRIMIRDINGDAAAGIYSFGYTIFSIINVTFNSLDSVWNTWFYKQMHGKKYEMIRKYSALYVGGILLLCVGLILICPELIIWLGTDKFAEAKYCTVPIIASGFFVFLYTLPATVEYYYEKTKQIAIATVSAAVLNIILNYIFIRQYGYIAAAYTTLVTYALYFLFHYITAKKIHGNHIFSTTIILAYISILMGVMVLTLLTFDIALIRWPLAVLLCVIGLLTEEKEFGLISRYTAVLVRRGKNEKNVTR